MLHCNYDSIEFTQNEVPHGVLNNYDESPTGIYFFLLLVILVLILITNKPLYIFDEYGLIRSQIHLYLCLIIIIIWIALFLLYFLSN